jgi:TPR repeat protein
MQKITTPQKTLMRCLFPIVFTMLMAGQAWAGPEEDALAAYLRKDYAQVLKIVKPPAIKGEAWAQGWLADAYNNGEGVAQDYAEAVKWYRLAAEQGRANAQFNFGVMYDNGQGVVQNYAEAVKWYRLAAEQGYARPQSTLAGMYRKGQGVVQDYVEAVKWYRLSAQQGDAFAQYFLGYMYVSGEGVLKEYVKAHSWYNLAAVDSRHPNAANAANSRDSLAKHMTPQQIADAQKLAGDCQARQFKGCDCCS